MSIEVITEPPSKKLTSLEKVKLSLNITNSSQDELLNDMIDASSDFASSYCGRKFAKQTVKESLEGKGTPILMLSITPILELVSVAFDDQEIEGAYVDDAEAGFIMRRGGFRSTELGWPTVNRFPSPYAEKRWKVTYTGGFVLSGWDQNEHGPRTLPHDLERAIIDIVKAQFKARNMDGAMTRYRIGDTQVWWDEGGAGAVPENSRNILNYYRRAF